GLRVGQRLLPALHADEVDGTNSVPVSKRQHQYADQRNEAEAEKHEQGRDDQDAESTLCAANRWERLQRLGPGPGLRQRSEGGHVTSRSWRSLRSRTDRGWSLTKRAERSC